MDQHARIAVPVTTDRAQVDSIAGDSNESMNAHVFGRVEAPRIIMVLLAAIAVWFHLWEPFPRISLIGAVGILIGAWPIFREAAENAAARRMTMELSMSIAIVAAAAISQFFTALIITLFVLVAEVLERMTVSRGRRAIRDMMDFLPHSITVRDATGLRQATTDELRVGDSVLVNPGALVPVDGIVIGGHSFVDQSRITGESMPAEKVPESVAYAGTINLSGALEIRVERIGRDTSYGRIVEAVEHAERSRAPVQQLADRLAGYLVYFALAAAAVTFMITRDARSTISVIIVAGACGSAAGNAVGNPGGYRSLRAPRCNHQRRPLPRSFGKGEHRRARQDRHRHLWTGSSNEHPSYPMAYRRSKSSTLRLRAEMRSEHPLGKAIVNNASAINRPLREPERLTTRPVAALLRWWTAHQSWSATAVCWRSAQ